VSRATGGVAEAPPRKAEPAPELRRVARGGTLNLIGLVSMGVLGFALAVVLTHTLGARGSGTFFAGLAVFTILANITELGADTGATRFVARFRELRQHADLAHMLIIALVPAAVAGTAAAVGMIVWAEPLARIFSRHDPEEVATYLRLLGPFVPVTTVATVALSATRGFGTMRPAVVIDNFATPLLKPILVLIGAVGGITALGVSLSWGVPETLGCVAALVVLWRMVRGDRARAEHPARSVGAIARDFWGFSAPRGAAAALQITIIWFDLLLLSRYRSSADVGIYGAASRAVTFGTFALQAIRLAIAPQISAMLAREDRASAQTVFQTATWWLIALSWPLFLIFAIFGPFLLQVFGQEFSAGATALTILSLAMLVDLGTGTIGVVLLMGGKSWWNLFNMAVALALNIGLNIWLTPRYGMNGAAVAWAVSITVANLLALGEVWLFLGMRPFGRGYLPAVGASLACIGGLGLLLRGLFGPTALAFGLFVVIAVPVYGLVLWRLRRILRLDELVASLRGGKRRPGSRGAPGWEPGGSGGNPAKTLARSAARSWSLLTADLRPPPDALIIGTKRGGTTSLAAYLYAHPDVIPPVPRRLLPKGVRYLDEHPNRSPRWYRSHFATVLVRGPAHAPRKIAAEATANYFFHADGAAMLSRAAPDARAVVILRDPVERAWSHWRAQTRRGVETLSFEDALAAEEERLATLPLAARANIAYAGQGRYADLLPAWQEAFGDRLLVLLSEEMFADPAGTYARMLAFIGLAPFELDRYDAWNQRPAASGMRPETRAMLENTFADSDARLPAMLGRAVPWAR
jgi:O-antigen/teichoic acid export membrane protein